MPKGSHLGYTLCTALFSRREDADINQMRCHTVRCKQIYKRVKSFMTDQTNLRCYKLQNAAAIHKAEYMLLQLNDKAERCRGISD
jgi:hypothetical protein